MPKKTFESHKSLAGSILQDVAGACDGEPGQEQQAEPVLRGLKARQLQNNVVIDVLGVMRVAASTPPNHTPGFPKVS